MGSSKGQSIEGKRVLVTRNQSEGEACPLSDALTRLGAQVVALPMVSITPLAFPPPSIEGVDWLFFTSPNAVRYFFDRVESKSKLPLLASVGEATGRALKTLGLTPDFVSPGSGAVEAAGIFVTRYPVQSRQILWPCGNMANTEFEEALSLAGPRVTPCVVYETTPRTQLTPQEAALLSPAFDVIAFTSPSAIEGWLHTQQPLPDNTAVACIGPTTAHAAQTHLGRVDITAPSQTLEALAEAIARYFSKTESRKEESLT